jgi:hypothetical protein
MSNFGFMRRPRIATLVVGFVCLLAVSATAFAATGVPTIMSYQGRLADSSGNLLGGTGTTYYFKFSIWDNTTVGAGSKLWPTSAPSSFATQVRQGVFNVNIGDTANGYPDTLNYNFNSSSDIYLQIEVSSDNGTFQTLGPRQRITAAAFARVSGAVSGTDSSSFGTTTPFAGAQLNVEATSTTSILAVFRARAGQVADLLRFQDSLGNTLFSIDKIGSIFTSSTLSVSGTSTLATTTATQLTATGQTALANASTTNLTVNGTSWHIGDILPTTDISRSLGSTALRFLNTYTQNLLFTNATGTGYFAITGTSTLATTTVSQFTATGQTTLGNASTSAVSGTGFTFTNGSVTGTITATNASTSNLSATGLTVNNSSVTGTETVLNASTTNLSATGATAGALNVTGTSRLAGAVSASSTLEVTGTSRFNSTLSVLADILPTTDIARSLGSSALRFLNTFTQNLYASSSVVTNASSSVITLGIGSSVPGRLYFANASNNFFTQLVSSSTQAANLTFTLPGTQGSSGDVLKADGTGGMYWGTASGGALSGGINGYLARWTSPSTLSTGLLIDSGVVSGVNATSSTFTFNVQGSSAVNPFNVASSTGASLFSVDQAGKLTFTNASTTAVTGGGFTFTNGSVTGTITATNASTSNLSATGLTTGALNVTGTSLHQGAISASSTFEVTGASRFNSTLSVLADILPTTDIARSLGTNALRFLNLFSQNIFATSSVITNGTSSNYFSTNLGVSSATATASFSSPVYTGPGAVTLSSGNSSGLTIDSASGRVALATGDFLKTSISGVSGAAAGDIWYDTSDNKYKINENGTTKILCNLTDTGCGAGGSGVSLDPSVAQTDSTASSSIFINKTSTGNFVQFQKNGLDIFTVANSGGISVMSDTADIVKTTTGTTRLQDFSVTGSSFQNASSSNDQISIDDGTITLEGTIAASSPAVTTNAAVGRGAIVIYRDDGKYIIIHGNSTTGVSLWDGATTGAMSAASTVLNAAAGVGAVALKRPDGRYLVVHAGSSLGTTSLYDPFNIQATVAGPAVCAASAIKEGTNAILRDDGKYLIFCGGFNTTSLYDPTANSITVGPTLPSSTFGSGAHALARPDGTYLIFKGGNTAGTAIYNPYNSTTGIGTMTDVTITNAPTIATSSLSLRLQDGTFMVIPGATNTYTIYDPKGTTASASGTFTTVSGAGNGPSATLQEGAQVLWRQDGNYLLIVGSGSTVTNVIKPGAASGSRFVTTNAPSLSAAAGVGLLGFMMPDGRYAVLRGGGTGMDYYDMGFVIGGRNAGTGALASYYETECISSTTLSDRSVISWRANAEGSIKVEYRTVTSPSACSTGTYATTTNGDTLSKYVSGNDSIQLRITFKRDRPVFVDQEWGIVKQNQTRYRRVNSDPALYDISILNGMALHRTQFDFGDSTATSGPVSVNITNDKNNSLAISLEAGVGYGSTASTAVNGGGIYTGAFGVNSPLTTTATSGTVIMRRPDNKFVVLSGNPTTANAQLYDSEARTFTALGTTPAAGTGVGALAFKRPDGKYLIVLGNALTTTSIFDPVLNTFTAGPALTGAAGAGSQAIPLPNGRVLIMHGNFSQTSSIYDPIQNIMVAGPSPTTVVGLGSIVIPRPDGKYFFIPGVITPGCTALNTVANMFDPYTMTFTNVNTPGLTGTGPGAFAFQRKDGLWVIVRGGSTITTCAGTNATHIYNPVNNKIVAGPNLSAVAGNGASLIPRPDGRPLIVHGSSTTATSIYIEELGAYTTDIGGPVGAFIAGPTLQAAAGAGSVAFQKADGKFTLINGGTVTTSQLYDGGWVQKGIYKTEYFNLGSKLTSSSVLTWRANTYTNISVEAKTAASEAAMQAASFRELAKSGALINPTAGDTYLQLNFNFSRLFPMTNPVNLYRDVWANGGTVMAAAYIKPDIPTLYEYKVTNDIDLLDLRSDGISVFRVNSNGDLFTQVGATLNTSGADLAERYTSLDELEKGEVVSIDPNNKQGVKRAMYQYQPDVLGVVSTEPGFVTGAYTVDSYPIALVGRVPVKVSTENGTIRAGDFLTMSSVPGHAMKATLAGRVIGKALETLDQSTLTDCPASQFIIENRKCGTIMMFVNLIDYQGIGIDMALSDWKTKRQSAAADGDYLGLSIDDSSFDNVEGLNNSQAFSFGDDNSADILAFLEDMKRERAAGVSGGQSEIFTERISASDEIISPRMITSLIEAKEGNFGSVRGLTLSADSVETKELSVETVASRFGGLTFEFTPAGSIVLRKGRVAGVSTSTAPLASSTEESPNLDDASSTDIFATATSSDVVVSFDNDGNAYFAGEVIADKVSSGALSVSGKAVFDGGLEVTTIGNASSTLNMWSDTFFFGRPYFTSDTGGTATIRKGARSVDILFDREYIENPIVNTSVVFTSTTTSETIQKLFANDIRFIIINRTTKGFTIYLSKPSDEEIAFNWVALAVKDSKEFTSKSSPDDRDTAPIIESVISSTSTDRTDEPVQEGASEAEKTVSADSASTTSESASSTTENEPSHEVTPFLDPHDAVQAPLDETASEEGISVPSF